MPNSEKVKQASKTMIWYPSKQCRLSASSKALSTAFGQERTVNVKHK